MSKWRIQRTLIIRALEICKKCCLLWNVQGISTKLRDSDFLAFISRYDVLIFTETWASATSHLEIKGHSYFNCPRPKYNFSAKRNSGGIIVYYKDKYRSRISLSKSDCKGMMWCKFDKESFNSEKDVYLCICYVPPEDSSLYTNSKSDLYQLDFYEYQMKLENTWMLVTCYY